MKRRKEKKVVDDDDGGNMQMANKLTLNVFFCHLTNKKPEKLKWKQQKCEQKKKKQKHFFLNCCK